ncbi:hypothetical protein ACOZ06_001277 [Cronobacter muytjensii]|nr:hypothetical protein [Cronobacter muytjensii]
MKHVTRADGRHNARTAPADIAALKNASGGIAGAGKASQSQVKAACVFQDGQLASRRCKAHCEHINNQGINILAKNTAGFAGQLFALA